MLWRPRNQDLDWLRAGFSERAGGVSEAYGPGELNLGWTDSDSAAQVAENRRRWTRAVWRGAKDKTGAAEVFSDPPELATLAQVHSAESLVLRAGTSPRTGPEGRTTLRGDGLTTLEPGVLLGIQTADCVPVLVVDARRRAVAGFHAGWRGTAARIVEQGIGQMHREFGSRPEDLWAAVGPAVADCCYSVGEEVRERFLQEFRDGAELLRCSTTPPRWLQDRASPIPPQPTGERRNAAEQAGASWFLDLREANRRQLLASGIPEAQVELTGGCTACSRTPEGRMRYFSYRAENGHTGRMMALIGIFERPGGEA